MNRDVVINELENSLNEFQQLVSSFDEKQINERPYEGSWTPGQITQHIVMANSGFGDVLKGPVKNTERAPDEQVGKIKRDFLDFTLKMDAPDFIVPHNKAYHKV